jgi:shikimate kinase
MGVVLIGYRGSGKTTVGKLLASRLGREFFDCDQLIVERAGKSIREIFAEGGEPAFRDLESAAIAELTGKTDAVIAVGGGAILREQNRRMLSPHKIVYLRCAPAELLRRIQADPATGENRPNLTQLGGGLEEIQTLLAAREPIYQSAMHFDVDVTTLTAVEAAETIAQKL